MKYDSTLGTFNGSILVKGANLVVNGNTIVFSMAKNPAAILWADAGAEYVVDATGVFIKADQANAHTLGGARKFFVCSPSVDIPMFVVGVNEKSYNGKIDVLSGASCTTNAISPLAKAIHDKFTITEALINTMHAYTVSQKLVDGPSSKSLRDGRSAPQNIIPSTTSAAVAVAKVLPELERKITELAMIVPISSVSVVDLTCRIEKEASLDEIRRGIQEAANGSLKGILAYTDEEVVSNDMKGNPHSCIFNAKASIALNKNLFKLVGWYDHQWAYSNRILDLIAHVDKVDASSTACNGC